jgi:hypothetical protein
VKLEFHSGLKSRYLLGCLTVFGSGQLASSKDTENTGTATEVTVWELKKDCQHECARVTKLRVPAKESIPLRLCVRAPSIGQITYESIVPFMGTSGSGYICSPQIHE